MKVTEIIKTELKEGFVQSKWLPLLTAYAVLSPLIGPSIHLPYMHFPFIAIALFLFLQKRCKIDLVTVLFLLYLPINIMVTQPDGVFRSWERLGMFIVIILVASPLLRGSYVEIYRRKLLIGSLFICTLLGLGSFICYFIGVNYMGNQYDGSEILNYQGSAGGFGGLLFQSIALGMLSGLGLLYLIYRMVQQEKNKRKWYYVAIIVLAIAILTSAARSALLSVTAGGLMMLYQLNKRRGKFIPVLMGILFVVLVTFPLWENFTIGLQKKQVANAELGAYGTRTEKWTARMEEFSSSPIFGVGFAAQDVNGKDYYDKVTGTVEPGSSWLGILSMTGVIGFIFVLIIVLRPFFYLKSNPSPYNSLLMGLLVFISMHMISEGYIFAGGGPLCLIAWLIFGCCNDVRYCKN